MIKIENKPVGVNPELVEIKEALKNLKIGQSFLISPTYSSAARNYYVNLEGKFGTRSEGNQLRIGRIA